MDGVFDSRIAKPRAGLTPAAGMLGWAYPHGGSSKKAAHKDQRGGRGSIEGGPGPAGDGAACLSRHRCWISMGRCRGGQGGPIPAAGRRSQDGGRGTAFALSDFEGAWTGGEGRGREGRGRGPG
jgi:hypothetical protein